MKYASTVPVIIFMFSIILTTSCKKQPVKKILFFDNFEGYNTNHSIHQLWKTEGNITLNTDKAFSGTQSLKLISGEGFQKKAFAHYDGIFPIKNNSYYGSMMLYINEASPNGVHWTMIQGSGKIEKSNHTAEVRYGGQHHKKLMANYDTQGIKSDCWKHSKFSIPEKQWTKYQWYFNGNTNTMKLWVNDSLINELTIIEKGSGCLKNETADKWIFPVFERQTIGWVDYQKGGGQRELWIDDVTFWIDE